MIQKLKNIYKSKTMIFALMISILGVIQSSLPDLRVVLTDEQYGIVTIIIGISIAILRFVTTMGLDEK